MAIFFGEAIQIEYGCKCMQERVVVMRSEFERWSHTKTRVELDVKYEGENGATTTTKNL
jgi:hypothetical protein